MAIVAIPIPITTGRAALWSIIVHVLMFILLAICCFYLSRSSLGVKLVYFAPDCLLGFFNLVFDQFFLIVAKFPGFVVLVHPELAFSRS